MKSLALVDAALRGATNTSRRGLVMVNLSGSPLDGWWELFRQSWDSSHKAIINSLTDFENMLEGAEEICGLVCVASPASRVEALINSGSPPTQALASWQSESEALLAIYRTHYRRMTIADSACLVPNVDCLRQYLAERTDATLKTAESSENCDAYAMSSTDRDFNPLSRLLALQALTQPVAMQISSELEASSLPLSNNVSLMKSLDEIYTKSIDNSGSAKSVEMYSEENKRLRADLHNTQVENEKVIAQLMRVQEELEKCLVARQDHDDVVNELNRRIKSLKKAALNVSAETQLVHTKLEQQLRSKEKSVKELQRASNQLRKELKVREEAVRHHKRARSRVSAELAQMTAELTLVYSSRSWRLTSPLRKAVSSFRPHRRNSV